MKRIIWAASVIPLTIVLASCGTSEQGTNPFSAPQPSDTSASASEDATAAVSDESPATEAPPTPEPTLPPEPVEAPAGYTFLASDFQFPKIATALHEAGFDAFLSQAKKPNAVISQTCSTLDGEVKGSAVPRSWRRELTDSFIETGSPDDWNWEESRAQAFVSALFDACYSTGTATAMIPATMAQENAMESARNYLSFSGFSRTGLIGQLEFEGYSTADATYAVDHVPVDWMKEAAQSARNYMDVSSFSRSGLIDQLLYEGFTAEEAEHGAQAVGY